MAEWTLNIQVLCNKCDTWVHYLSVYTCYQWMMHTAVQRTIITSLPSSHSSSVCVCVCVCVCVGVYFLLSLNSVNYSTTSSAESINSTALTVVVQLTYYRWDLSAETESTLSDRALSESTTQLNHHNCLLPVCTGDTQLIQKTLNYYLLTYLLTCRFHSSVTLMSTMCSPVCISRKDIRPVRLPQNYTLHYQWTTS